MSSAANLTRREFLTYAGLATASTAVSGISIPQSFAATTAVALTGVATGLSIYAVDFDGTNDFLNRATDLIGNADGKAFTFSAWFYGIPKPGETHTIYWAGTPGLRFRVEMVSEANGKYYYAILAMNAAGTTIFGGATFPGVGRRSSEYTWNHLLVSIDLSNVANRYIFLNDIDFTSEVSWGAYTNDTIDFTGTVHFVGDGSGLSKLKGRLAHVFMDHSYRDLSVVENRRKFITADLKPMEDLATSMNPILYFPMDNPATCHINKGTGGDFILNGTVARSGRSPSKHNCPYSDLDGSTDYLSRLTSLGSDASQLTVSFWFSLDSIANGQYFYYSGNTSSSLQKFWVSTEYNGGLRVEMYGSMSGGWVGWWINTPFLVIGRNYHLVFSVDTSNSSLKHVYINGVSKTVVWNGVFDGTINFNGVNSQTIGAAAGGSSKLNGRMGDFYLAKSYVDLSQPNNLAKFVVGSGSDAKPADLGASGEVPTGVVPAIYLPLYGNNPGKNYGTGGDFTVNSGPFAGARGPSEFWGNFAKFDGSTGYLERASALSGVSDGKMFSCVFYSSWSISQTLGFFQTTDGSNNRVMIYQVPQSSPSRFGVQVVDSGGIVVDLLLNSGISQQDVFTFICIDTTSAARCRIFHDNVENTSVVGKTINNRNLPLANLISAKIGYVPNASGYMAGKISQFYFTTEYIDFTLEANRLKFRDAFGSPVDLGVDGSAPTGSVPAIYMRFDPSNLGKNSGSGGDFAIAGIVTDGGQL